MEVEMTSPPEAMLVRRAAKGDTRAFDELVDRHYRALFGLAYRILGNPEDASDAVQEAFVKAYRALSDFDFDRPFRPWLCRICSNVAIDIARARSKAPEPLESYEATLPDQTHPPISDLVARQDGDAELRHAIANLPEKYRQVVVLRHFQHMEVNEIARALDAPEGTVKSWLFRARAMLREQLETLRTRSFPTEELAR